MKIIRKAGDTSNILQIFIQDSSSTVGAGLTGLVFNSGSLTAYYHKDTDTTATAITLVTMTVGTFTSSGFKEIDSTNMPGWYQFCPPDAALSTSGTPKMVGFHLKGATNMAPLAIEVQLVAVDVQDATAFGLSRIDGTITSRMATYTQPTGFLAATFPSGTVANTTNITAGTITTVTTVTNQLTAAAIATGVWQDTTSGDFTVSSSIGKSLYTSGNAPGASSGIALVGSNMGTITGALTAAQIATGVWQDTTSGDFTTALSVGKSLMNGVSLGTGLTVNDITTKTGYSLSGTQTFNNTGTWTGNIVGTLSTLTTYTGNTVQTGDAYARLGAPAGASVSADVAAVKAVDDAVKVQTDKMTFTVANKIDANMLNLNGDATSAANVAKTTRAIVRATASGVPTTTSIPTSACTPAGIVADQFKGRIITFDADTTTSALRGQATDITASSAASTPTFTCTALTTSPVSGDTFSIT